MNEVHTVMQQIRKKIRPSPEAVRRVRNTLMSLLVTMLVTYGACLKFSRGPVQRAYLKNSSPTTIPRNAIATVALLWMAVHMIAKLVKTSKCPSPRRPVAATSQAVATRAVNSALSGPNTTNVKAFVNDIFTRVMDAENTRYVKGLVGNIFARAIQKNKLRELAARTDQRRRNANARNAEQRRLAAEKRKRMARAGAMMRQATPAPVKSTVKTNASLKKRPAYLQPSTATYAL